MPMNYAQAQLWDKLVEFNDDKTVKMSQLRKAAKGADIGPFLDAKTRAELAEKLWRALSAATDGAFSSVSTGAPGETFPELAELAEAEAAVAEPTELEPAEPEATVAELVELPALAPRLAEKPTVTQQAPVVPASARPSGRRAQPGEPAVLGAPTVHLGHPVLPISRPTGPAGAHNPLAHAVNPTATAITPNPWAPQPQHATHIFVGPPPGAAPPAPPPNANPDAALDKHVAIAAVALSRALAAAESIHDSDAAKILKNALGQISRYSPQAQRP